MLSGQGAPLSNGEGTDLPSDLQRELLALQARGARATYYELLKIQPSADKAAIRDAYVDQSKRFHPDRHRSKRLGAFGPLLAEAFRRVTEAYSILNDADRRAAYDSILSITLDGEGQKAVQARVLAREEEERRAAERRRRLFLTKGFAKLGAARRLYEEALAHVADGERGLAMEALKVAVQLDPQRKEIRDKIRDLEAELRKARAFFWFEQAKVAEVKDDWATALRSYETGLQIDGRSGSGMLGAARAALEIREFEKSSSWAIRAVEYAPQAAEPKLILARAELGLGQKAKAKALVQSVLEANPEHKEARALLKSM